MLWFNSDRGLKNDKQAKIQKRIQVSDTFDNHIAAAAAIAAIGASELDILFPPEADAPVAAIAGADKDLCGIEKLHGKGLASASSSCTHHHDVVRALRMPQSRCRSLPI